MILTCSSSLTLSIGATAVLEIAAATPPAKKSLAKEMAASAMAALNVQARCIRKYDVLNVQAAAGGSAESDGDAAEDRTQDTEPTLEVSRDVCTRINREIMTRYNL